MSTVANLILVHTAHNQDLSFTGVVSYDQLRHDLNAKLAEHGVQEDDHYRLVSYRPSFVLTAQNFDERVLATAEQKVELTQDLTTHVYTSLAPVEPTPRLLETYSRVPKPLSILICELTDNVLPAYLAPRPPTGRAFIETLPREAAVVDILVRTPTAERPILDVIDHGAGMTALELNAALTVAGTLVSDAIDADRATRLPPLSGVLGRSGRGLKDSAFNMGKRLDVLSATQEEGVRTAIFDLADILAKDKWQIQQGRATVPMDECGVLIGDHFTRVRVASLKTELLDQMLADDFALRLASTLHGVYHHYIHGIVGKRPEHLAPTDSDIRAMQFVYQRDTPPASWLTYPMRVRVNDLESDDVATDQLSAFYHAAAACEDLPVVVYDHEGAEHRVLLRLLYFPYKQGAETKPPLLPTVDGPADKHTLTVGGLWRDRFVTWNLPFTPLFSSQEPSLNKLKQRVVALLFCNSGFAPTLNKEQFEHTSCYWTLMNATKASVVSGAAKTALHGYEVNADNNVVLVNAARPDAAPVARSRGRSKKSAAASANLISLSQVIEDRLVSWHVRFDDDPIRPVPNTVIDVASEPLGDAEPPYQLDNVYYREAVLDKAGAHDAASNVIRVLPYRIPATVTEFLTLQVEFFPPSSRNARETLTKYGITIPTHRPYCGVEFKLPNHVYQYPHFSHTGGKYRYYGLIRRIYHRYAGAQVGAFAGGGPQLYLAVEWYANGIMVDTLELKPEDIVEYLEFKDLYRFVSKQHFTKTIDMVPVEVSGTAAESTLASALSSAMQRTTTRSGDNTPLQMQVTAGLPLTELRVRLPGSADLSETKARWTRLLRNKKLRFELRTMAAGASVDQSTTVMQFDVDNQMAEVGGYEPQPAKEGRGQHVYVLRLDKAPADPAFVCNRALVRAGVYQLVVSMVNDDGTPVRTILSSDRPAIFPDVLLHIEPIQATVVVSPGPPTTPRVSRTLDMALHVNNVQPLNANLTETAQVRVHCADAFGNAVPLASGDFGLVAEVVGTMCSGTGDLSAVVPPRLLHVNSTHALDSTTNEHVFANVAICGSMVDGFQESGVYTKDATVVQCLVRVRLLCSRLELNHTVLTDRFFTGGLPESLEWVAPDSVAFEATEYKQGTVAPAVSVRAYDKCNNVISGRHLTVISGGDALKDASQELSPAATTGLVQFTNLKLDGTGHCDLVLKCAGNHDAQVTVRVNITASNPVSRLDIVEFLGDGQTTRALELKTPTRGHNLAKFYRYGGVYQGTPLRTLAIKLLGRDAARPCDPLSHANLTFDVFMDVPSAHDLDQQAAFGNATVSAADVMYHGGVVSLSFVQLPTDRSVTKLIVRCNELAMQTPRLDVVMELRPHDFETLLLHAATDNQHEAEQAIEHVTSGVPFRVQSLPYALLRSGDTLKRQAIGQSAYGDALERCFQDVQLRLTHIDAPTNDALHVAPPADVPFHVDAATPSLRTDNLTLIGDSGEYVFSLSDVSGDMDVPDLCNTPVRRVTYKRGAAPIAADADAPAMSPLSDANTEDLPLDPVKVRVVVVPHHMTLESPVIHPAQAHVGGGSIAGIGDGTAIPSHAHCTVANGTLLPSVQLSVHGQHNERCIENRYAVELRCSIDKAALSGTTRLACTKSVRFTNVTVRARVPGRIEVHAVLLDTTQRTPQVVAGVEPLSLVVEVTAGALPHHLRFAAGVDASVLRTVTAGTELTLAQYLELVAENGAALDLNREPVQCEILDDTDAAVWERPVSITAPLLFPSHTGTYRLRFLTLAGTQLNIYDPEADAAETLRITVEPNGPRLVLLTENVTRATVTLESRTLFSQRLRIGVLDIYSNACPAFNARQCSAAITPLVSGQQALTPRPTLTLEADCSMASFRDHVAEFAPLVLTSTDVPSGRYQLEFTMINADGTSGSLSPATYDFEYTNPLDDYVKRQAQEQYDTRVKELQQQLTEARAKAKPLRDQVILRQRTTGTNVALDNARRTLATKTGAVAALLKDVECSEELLPQWNRDEFDVVHKELQQFCKVYKERTFNIDEKSTDPVLVAARAYRTTRDTKPRPGWQKTFLLGEALCVDNDAVEKVLVKHLGMKVLCTVVTPNPHTSSDINTLHKKLWCRKVEPGEDILSKLKTIRDDQRTSLVQHRQILKTVNYFLSLVRPNGSDETGLAVLAEDRLRNLLLFDSDKDFNAFYGKHKGPLYATTMDGSYMATKYIRGECEWSNPAGKNALQLAGRKLIDTPEYAACAVVAEVCKLQQEIHTLEAEEERRLAVGDTELKALEEQAQAADAAVKALAREQATFSTKRDEWIANRIAELRAAAAVHSVPQGPSAAAAPSAPSAATAPSASTEAESMPQSAQTRQAAPTSTPPASPSKRRAQDGPSTGTKRHKKGSAATPRSTAPPSEAEETEISTPSLRSRGGRQKRPAEAPPPAAAERPQRHRR